MPEEIIKARIVFDTSNLRGVGGKLGDTAGTRETTGETKTNKTLKSISGSLSMSGKSMAKMGALAGVAAAGVGIAVSILKKIWQTAKEASPRLMASLKILGKAVHLAMRPIGDLLSMYLRPFALSFLRYSVGFYKWWADNRDTIKKVFDILLKFTFAPIIDLISGMKSIFKVGGNIYDWITDKLFGEEWSLSDTIKGWLGIDEDVNLFTAITDWLLGDTESGGLWGAVKEFLGLVEKISLLPFVLGFLGIVGVVDLSIKILNWLGMDIQWSLSTQIKDWLGLNQEVSLWSAITGWLGIGGDKGALNTSTEVGAMAEVKALDKKAAGIAGIWGIPYQTHEDVLITKSGGVHKFNPEDNIMATKGGFGGNNVNVTINVNALDASSISSSVIDRITRAVSESTRRNMARTTMESAAGF